VTRVPAVFRLRAYPRRRPARPRGEDQPQIKERVLRLRSRSLDNLALPARAKTKGGTGSPSHPARLCRPGRQARRAHPREKPGFSTYESGCGREADSPLEEDAPEALLRFGISIGLLLNAIAAPSLSAVPDIRRCRSPGPKTTENNRDGTVTPLGGVSIVPPVDEGEGPRLPRPNCCSMPFVPHVHRGLRTTHTTRIDEVSVARLSGLMLQTVIVHPHRSHMLMGKHHGKRAWPHFESSFSIARMSTANSGTTYMLLISPLPWSRPGLSFEPSLQASPRWLASE